jgi:hypothetical protein
VSARELEMIEGDLPASSDIVGGNNPYENMGGDFEEEFCGEEGSE